MELDFSFTLVTSIKKKSSKQIKQKEKKNIENCENIPISTVALIEKETLSLARKKKYQNYMKENKILKEDKKKNSKIDFDNSFLSDSFSKIDLVDNCDKLDDKPCIKTTDGEIKDYNFFEETENKENISPVKHESLVMNTNGSLNDKKCDNNLKFSAKNSSSFNKNSSCSSSSFEIPEYVELNKVSLRRHQLQTYKSNIKDEKLYVIPQVKDDVKEIVSHNQSPQCSSDKNVNHLLPELLSSSTINNKNDDKISPNSQSGNPKDSSNSIIDNSLPLNFDNNSIITRSVMRKKLCTKLSNSLTSFNDSIHSKTDCKKTPKGIKRSITVARNGFRKSLNSSESVYLRTTTKNKGKICVDSSSDADDDASSSFKSVVNEPEDVKNNVNENKVGLENNSRLSGVTSLVSDNSVTNNRISIRKSSLRITRKSDVVNCNDNSSDIFNNLKSNNDDSKNNNISRRELNIKSNTKMLTNNVSLNCSMDFENGLIDASTPQPVRKKNSRFSFKKTITKLQSNNEDCNKVNEGLQNVPLSLPLTSYESPLLTKSKVNDINKWLTDTEKICSSKNPFETSDSNNEDDDLPISVSPPLINKKHKLSHYVKNENIETEISKFDMETPLHGSRLIRKPLTEPNKVNSTVKSKIKHVQKRRLLKKEMKSNVSMDCGEPMDNPAARILNQLYGESWRALNALPMTEPKNNRQKRIDPVKPLMTERRKNRKSSMFSSSSSSDDHFEEFLEKTRLKRLELSKARSQLTKINESSFIVKSSGDEDTSLVLYQKVISSDIKKEIDALSDSKWSLYSHGSNKSCAKNPRRLSFTSKGSENTDSNTAKSSTIVSSKKNKKIKKKSPDKIIKRHLPINLSHHSSGSNDKKKKQRLVKSHKDGKIDNNVKTKLEDRIDKKDVKDKPIVVKIETPKTPKLTKDIIEQFNSDLLESENKLLTPKNKCDKIFQSTPRYTLSFLSSLSAITGDLRCHPDAVNYKKDYKNKKEELTRKLFMLYNKEVFENKLPQDMLLQWNGRMRSTSGYCYNRRLFKNSGEVIRTSRIVLSSKILDTPDRLRDTLIHEMCHAGTWIINGISDGHGPRWKYWASKAMLRFPELPKIKRCHDYDIKTKYTYKCTGCGYSFGRHSKSLDTERKRCGYCYGKFELLVNLKEKPGDRGNGRGGATPLSSVYSDTNTRTPRPVKGFALFVKQNYSEVKKSNNALPHKDVMKLLGQKFAQFKLTQNNDKELVSEQ